MIDPRELRIGNWVTCYERPILVDSIGSKGINIYATDDNKPYGLHSAVLECEHDFKELEGIPLTEELLVKAGFECLSHYDGEVMNVSFARNGLILTIENDEFDFIGVPVKYLHKLQNLFYEIADTELTIKL